MNANHPAKAQDLRSHRSLIDSDEVEWLTDIKHDTVALVNPLMQEAEEFYDEDLMAFCKRHLKLKTAVNAKRADKMASVAAHDQDLQEHPEGRVQRAKV